MPDVTPDPAQCRWRRLARGLPLLVGAAALGGCATTVPDPGAAVGMPPPAQAWSQPVPPGRDALAQWWRRFDDPDLARWVESALAAGTDVATAQAQLRRARALGKAALAEGGPAIGASGLAQVSRPAGGSSAGELFQAGFDASWELDLWGARAHAWAAAEADTRAAEATLAATQVAVAAEMAQLYVQWRSLLARAAHAEASLQAQLQTLQLVAWRRQAGLAGSLEVEQARSAAEQTRAQLPQLQVSQAQTRHAMAVLAGRDPAAPWPGPAPSAALPQPPQGLAVAVPAEALRQRPDLRVAQAQLEAAAERVAQADAARKPSVLLRTSTAWSALTLSGLGGASAAALLAGSVSQPLFDGGRRDAQREAQQSAFEASAQAYRAKVLQALQEVQDALAALEGARQRVQALHQADEASANAALLARHRHDGGLVDFQAVLDTQRTRLAVQDGLAQAQADWVLQHVRLYKALGGGWEPPTDGQGVPK